MCDSCQQVRINGVVCHEHGCREAWKDTPRACWGCGFDFLPENRFDKLCADCANPALEENEEEAE